ncbi:uncharacterized protein LOC134763669 [Penaeus indicus]|uniref:uncharacterized protein LOC134763669 n=1 Tax=Penaeus indicus TaxID=29960 RepID=UPI00300D9F73
MRRPTDGAQFECLFLNGGLYSLLCLRLMPIYPRGGYFEVVSSSRIKLASVLMLSMSTPGSSSGSHTCVFCSQAFTCKTDLQTHFRRHANGEIDIKGRPKMQQKAEEKCTLEEEEKVEKEDVIRKSPDEVVGKKTDGSVCDVCGSILSLVPENPL